MIAVEIEVDDQGKVTVGMPPQAEETGQQDTQEDKSYMSPAASVDDALKVARDMLTNPQAEQAAKQKGFESVDQGMSAGMGGMGG